MNVIKSLRGLLLASSPSIRQAVPWLFPKTLERLAGDAAARAGIAMKAEYRQQVLDAMPGYRPGDRVAELMAEEYVRAEFGGHRHGGDHGG